MSCFVTCLVETPTGWLAVLGRAHPSLLHLPIGIVPAIALLEFGALLLRREPPRGAVLALACFGALAGSLAAASGLVLAGEDYGGDVLGWHKVLGITLAAMLVLTAVLALLPRRLPFRLALLAAFALLLPTGHLGGTITHGDDFLFEPLRHPAADATPGKAPADAPAESAPVGSTYERTIAPLLERLCSKCHNPDKHKADLILTTPEHIVRGSENGPVLVPGEPEASPMLLRCELPLDDDDHMPPEDKPQPTAEEVAALRAWIAAGAPF